jgi:hypothetical protein
LFRKLPTDTSDGYADVPVSKQSLEYSLSRWQVDAHSFWRSNGNRLLTPDEMADLSPYKAGRLLAVEMAEHGYDHERHVAVGEAMAAKKRLPTTFMSLAPASEHPDVWSDISRIHTLNSSQSQRNLTNHICPLQFDIVDRLIRRFTNPGDMVYDPFGGIMTVPFRALQLGRQGRAAELNPESFRDGVRYLREAEAEMSTPTLFDMSEIQQEAAAG